MDIRFPSVAGVFYPSDAGTLHQDIDAYLRAVDEVPAKRPKALVSPHAGFVYSGPVAAFGYAAVRPYAQDIHRVILLAPAHRYPFRGLAVPSVDLFRTPMGDIPIDRAGVHQALGQPGVQTLDAAFDKEHAIEVQLPFLQEILARFQLVPILVGSASQKNISGLIDALWGGPETLVIVSSDLSHYLDYETAQRQDEVTRQAIESMESESLTGEHACGFLPLRGLLDVARSRGLSVKTLDMRNSGDTAGSRDQVVGYGSYAVYP